MRCRRRHLHTRRARTGRSAIQAARAACGSWLYQYRSDAMVRAVTRYSALVDELAQAIAAGDLPPGAALPSVRSLARDRGLAAGTVARAYAELARARARSRAASGPVTALRRPGAGTRVLTERLAREAGADPADIRGPEVDSHLDVALAVASGLADAGVCVRSAAVALGLEFVPLVWEPFELALPAEALPRAEPLLASLAEPAVARRAAELGGHGLAGSGAITPAR